MDDSKSLLFDHGTGALGLADGADHATGYIDNVFRRRYLPRTRLLLVGRGADLEVAARVAKAAELDVTLATPDQATAASVADMGRPQPDSPHPRPALGHAD